VTVVARLQMFMPSMPSSMRHDWCARTPYLDALRWH